MNNHIEEIKEKINEADMILIGLGEEFDEIKEPDSKEKFLRMIDHIAQSGHGHLVPKLQRYINSEGDMEIIKHLSSMKNLLSDKNYFVISTSNNESIRRAGWQENRLVMPCGTGIFKQCASKCQEGLMTLTDEDVVSITKYFDDIESGKKEKADKLLGVCPKCGGRMVLNSTYAPDYDENGYLKDWDLYMKWLQGTVNKNLLILELGVGMRFPSIIRFSFEKIAYYNNKSSFYRINENLYQMPDNLGNKGVSIANNAIAWLGLL